MTAVTTSTSSTAWRPMRANSAAASAGASSVIADWMLMLMPLTRISLSAGTIWGRSAPTAGVCTPAPRDRMARVA